MTIDDKRAYKSKLEKILKLLDGLCFSGLDCEECGLALGCNVCKIKKIIEE